MWAATSQWYANKCSILRFYNISVSKEQYSHHITLILGFVNYFLSQTEPGVIHYELPDCLPKDLLSIDYEITDLSQNVSGLDPSICLPECFEEIFTITKSTGELNSTKFGINSTTPVRLKKFRKSFPDIFIFWLIVLKCCKASWFLITEMGHHSVAHKHVRTKLNQSVMLLLFNFGQKIYVTESSLKFFFGKTIKQHIFFHRFIELRFRF